MNFMWFSMGVGVTGRGDWFHVMRDN
jgi:hypothetical protein